MSVSDIAVEGLKKKEGRGLNVETTEIYLRTTMEANVQRLLYALATPEYIEAWLQLPGAVRVECHPEERSFDRYRIDAISPEGRKRSICAMCRLLKPNCVIHLWDSFPAGDQSRSEVEFRILRGPTSITITLTHRTLDDKDSLESYHLAWQHSLLRLRNLVEPATSGRYTI
jgi:uncharacterized protein YndB with AHSA1/START domain